MKVVIWLGEKNTNPVKLSGTLSEYVQGDDGSTVVMKGGQNYKTLSNLFEEIREEGEIINSRTPVIKGSVCIKEKDTETIYLPRPIRVHIGVEI